MARTRLPHQHPGALCPARRDPPRSWAASGIDGTSITISSNGVSSAGLVTVSATAPSLVKTALSGRSGQGSTRHLGQRWGSSSQSIIAVNQNLAGGVWLPLTGGALSGALSGPMATFDNLSAPQAIGDNRIINGDMRIDQRNNGVNGTANGYTVDRWTVSKRIEASKITQLRQPRAPAYWRSSLLVSHTHLYFTTTTAFTPAAADNFFFQQPIEAEFVSDLSFGSANASPVTLSFWAFCSASGTYSGALCNASSGPTRCYPFNFSIPVGNTWTKIALTIPGDTSGTWPVTGAGAGMSLRFDLGSGSNYRATAGAWASGNFVGATGAAGIVATGGLSLYLTGVKLEIGSVATPFNRQSLAKSMADCQRYYQVYTGITFGGYSGAGSFNMYAPLTIPAMRANPTINFSSTSYSNSSGVSVQGASTSFFTMISTITGVGSAWTITNASLSAEL